MMLTTNFVVLYTVINGFFFVYRPQNVSEIYICLDDNGTRDDTWPVRWNNMLPSGVTPAMLMFELPKNVTEYKLRFIFSNRSYVDTSWKYLESSSTTSSSSTPSSTSFQQPQQCRDGSITDDYLTNLSTVKYLLYYLTVYSSIILLKNAISIFQKIKNTSCRT